MTGSESLLKANLTIFLLSSKSEPLYYCPKRTKQASGSLKKPVSLEASIRSFFAPILRTDGFKGSGRIFRASAGGMICLVDVQGSQWGGSFAVNLAVQPIVVPTLIGTIADPKKIVQRHCVFSQRLSDEKSDHWWHYSDQETLNCAVDDAARMYQRVGGRFFERFTSPQNELDQFAPDSSIPPGYAAQLRQGDCGVFRVLAHMRLADHKVDEAVRFAERALADAGPSWHAYTELQSLIQRAQNCDPSLGQGNLPCPETDSD